MDKKSKILIWFFVVLIIGAVGVTYWRIMIKRDYIIQSQVDCDPYTEECFVHVCDPTAGEECTGKPEEDTSYYKIIRKNASRIPMCDPNKDENCVIQCEANEPECEYELCSADNVPEGETCNNPEEYTQNNPPADEPADETEAAPAEE